MCRGTFTLIILVFASVCTHSARVERATTDKRGRPGGRQKISGAQNDLQLEDLAKFAVQQNNANQNSGLQYICLESAEQQVVAGTMYFLDIEATPLGGGGTTKLYEAKVWVKPWLNFKSLEDFKEKQSMAPQPLCADLVKGNNQEVEEAARHALKDLRAKSNSLIPYELKEVISVHAQVVAGATNYNLLLRVERGSQQEQIEAQVVHTGDNLWVVKDVYLRH